MIMFKEGCVEFGGITRYYNQHVLKTSKHYIWVFYRGMRDFRMDELDRMCGAMWTG